MAIVVNKRPYDRNWSGNPIHYTLYSAAAEADATIYFEYRVRFKRMDAAAYSTIITLPYRPVSGTAKIDIEGILDGLLEHEMPFTPNTDEYNSPYLSNKATGYFYIQYREITSEEPDPEWEDDEAAEEKFVIKGGISFGKWRGDNYWTNYFSPKKPFLTWEKNFSLHSIKERMYLAFLNTTDVYTGDIKMKRTVKFTDGSENVAYLNFPAPKDYVSYFPTGGKQLEIDEIDPNKNIYWWEMQVYNVGVNPEEPMSEAFRYYADNRPDYNAITLNYRNSLGGLSSARIRGVIDYTQERKFTTNERIVLHDYFNSHFIKGRVTADDSSEIQVLKGDIGHMTAEEQDRHRDIHYKREVWWEKEKKWLPVMVLTSSGRLKLSTDKLFGFPIEFSIASGDDHFYTPDNVSLQEASEPVGLVCTAVINTLTSNYVPGTGWVISWVLASGTPNKYQISTPGVSGGAPGETTGTSYAFSWLPVGDNVITVRPLCLIGGVYYFGAAQTITVTVAAVCVNVGISSAPVYLPDAVENVPYNFVINLTGTAPFNISNIVKPSWMTVAVSGSTVVLSGTPSTGDIGTGINVSFDLDNCSGAGTVSYSDTISVLSASGNGTFTITNEATGSNFVKNVLPNSPAFYSISSGSMPVTAGQTTSGVLTQAVTDPVSVFVIIANPGYSIKLLKNGVVQETIEVPTSGIYSFAAVSFAVTDSMEIKLVFE